MVFRQKEIKAVYLWTTKVRPSIEPVNQSFSYTWADQVRTVPYTQEYIITACGAWNNFSAWWLGRWTLCLTEWQQLSIVVWQTWYEVCRLCCPYWFGWCSTYDGCDWSGLSWVFTWCSTVLASDSDRALVIGWWAGSWRTSSIYWGAWWWACGQDWVDSWYGTRWSWWTQTAHWSQWNKWSCQFQGGNWSWTYWFGWGWWWRWWNGSAWDSSCLDDKGAWWGSGYVISTATDVTLTQWWWAPCQCNWCVTIVSVYQW